MVYPLSEYTGSMRTPDWSQVPSFPAGDTTSGDQETQWVVPEQFLDLLPTVLDEVPARPGEEALYDQVGSLVDAAAADPAIADAVREETVQTQQTLMADLFEFRNIGIPVAHRWSTQNTGAQFGTDYLSRTAMARANIFVNTPTETTYFYQDLDTDGARLDGSRSYTVTFPASGLPPIRGFWSLTLYNEHHFFHPNDLGRYSLGTKNKNLSYRDDGSLTLYASTTPPTDAAHRANWLPAPEGPFSLYLRAYWPDDQILNGDWTPPAVVRT